MRKFIIKISIFCIPFVLLAAAELFIFPPDMFCFRVWEGLMVKHKNSILTGPFYPGMTIRKAEEGDLAHHTAAAVKKDVIWTTDASGYRNEDLSGPADIVVIGDSMATGSALTQKDTITSVLSLKLGANVYNMAPADVNDFISDPGFKDKPPDIVIIESTEIFMAKLKAIRPDTKVRSRVLPGNIKTRFAVYIDRLSKMNMLLWIRAGMYRAITGKKNYQQGDIFFWKGPSANNPLPDTEIMRIAGVIKSYNDYFMAAKIKMYFMPVPNKENIFYDYLGTGEPENLKKLELVLKGLGVNVIDLEEPFRKAYKRNIKIYHADDTHWNEAGVNLAADTIVKTLNYKPR